MTDTPEIAWIAWPQSCTATGLAFSCQARPPARRIEYIRRDIADAAVLAERNRVLDEIEELLDNAIANGGGLDAGNGKFITNAHWDYEIRDQLNELRARTTQEGE